ncbi:MAG: pseudouridine-5'-phosphate glycosidase [Candidatus Puniceispirillales bacterium]|tara:strand:+ start:1551 stop:2468 length:918 start_codon:yes stop_codon:yes gene_type:complete
MNNLKIQLSSEVEAGKKLGQPIVALETTIVSHGMPYPDNLNTALEVENIIREEGAIPATIGVVGGKIKIGMSKQEIELFAKSSDVTKVSRRDIPIVMSNNANGATTVAGTILLAKLAGIDVMATGGIGGVHRDAENTFDISADLQELSKTDVTVVCAGPKSILDIGLTLEYLETMGVPIIGYNTNLLPTFYCHESKFEVDFNYTKPSEIAKVMLNQKHLSLKGGMLVCNPIPKEFSIDSTIIENSINSSMEIAKKNNVKGKDLTPFLLQNITSLTEGETLKSNIKLMFNNAKLAAKIAISFNEII